jgi:acetoin:2,6-dichlorophenolindophenol oxidoreductase subunit alpha
MKQLSKNDKLEMLRMMMTIRNLELRMQDNFKIRSKNGEDVGAIHSCEGQEAIAVGVSSCLRKDDYVFSTHRGHGHAVAKGVDLNKVVAELLGRATGCSGGRGGSMHLFDVEVGLMGGNGIVGGGLPLALGTGYSALARGTDQVTVCYIGEGAGSQGSFHESVNMAAVQKFPVIYVLENNLYSATTHVELNSPIEDLSERAKAYGIPGYAVDGNDIMAVSSASDTAISRARAGEGPTLLECKTYRHRPHCMVIAEHRDLKELAEWKQYDPITLFEKKLIAEGEVDQNQINKIASEVEKSLDDAIAFAEASPMPSADTVAEFVLA